VDATQDSTETGDDSGSISSAPLARLLAELDPTTDLARLVERIARNGLPWVVVPMRPSPLGSSEILRAGRRCRRG
jgi:hypothetical protein